ncbi:MAG: hypothetical protein LBG58_05470 [Planctomycetaceae bacterium]|jgi:hypothetical protein|nr:hypothetical protein [Planctomycetaceae bacterium]
MGFPYHFLKQEYRYTWADILKKGLEGYATVAMFNVLPNNGESHTVTNDVGEVYVVGNHGHFTLGFDRFDERCGVMVGMFPFFTSVQNYGQDMVNLEERIHRVFDSMSIALTPEAIERYENNYCTKFFRLLNREHCFSLDFAHRSKKQLSEENFDSEPIRKRFFNPNYVQCKPELVKSWTEIFRQRLQGIATVQVTTATPQSIVSPNGQYRVEAPTSIEIKHENINIKLQGESNDNVYWIERPSISVESIGNNTIARVVFDTFQEVTENKLPINVVEKQTEIKSNSFPIRFYGKTDWFHVFLFGYLGIPTCIVGILCLFDIVRPADGSSKYIEGIMLMVFSFLFILPAITSFFRSIIHQKPLIRIYKEGIQIRNSVPTTLFDFRWFFIFKNIRIQTLQWEKIDSILCGREILVIIGTSTDIDNQSRDQNNLSIQMFYNTTSFTIPVENVGDTLRYFQHHSEKRQLLPSWKNK